MLAQPGTLIAPVRTVTPSSVQNAAEVVRDLQVAELVDNHVIDHIGRRQHEPPIEGKVPSRQTRARMIFVCAKTGSTICWRRR